MFNLILSLLFILGPKDVAAAFPNSLSSGAEDAYPKKAPLNRCKLVSHKVIWSLLQKGYEPSGHPLVQRVQSILEGLQDSNSEDELLAVAEECNKVEIEANSIPTLYPFKGLRSCSHRRPKKVPTEAVLHNSLQPVTAMMPLTRPIPKQFSADLEERSYQKSP